MLKKEISYVDYNGDKVTESLYFNLSSVEQTRLFARYTKGGYKDLEEYAKHLMDIKDTEAMVTMVEDVILSSYGEKSPDGRAFVKTKAVRESFEYSIAYSVLFEELLTNEASMRAFFQGLVPKKQDSDKPAASVSVVA